MQHQQDAASPNFYDCQSEQSLPGMQEKMRGSNSAAAEKGETMQPKGHITFIESFSARSQVPFSLLRLKVTHEKRKKHEAL